MTDIPKPGEQKVPARPIAVGTEPNTTFHEAVGGDGTFVALGRAFYELVARDPVLRPLYPGEDLHAAEDHLVLFLIQYWGGTSKYLTLRGHPRLRMRHAPFAIGPVERDAWLAAMRTALDTLALADDHDALLWEYLVRAAFSLQNREFSDSDTLATGE